MSDDNKRKRRSVLKTATGVAAGFAFAATGAAAAADGDGLENVDTEDCTCSYEYKCEGYCYKDGSRPQSWRRECCECDNGRVCDNWSRMGMCCW